MDRIGINWTKYDQSRFNGLNKTEWTEQDEIRPKWIEWTKMQTDMAQHEFNNNKYHT